MARIHVRRTAAVICHKRSGTNWDPFVPLSIQFGDDIYRDGGSERQRLLRSFEGDIMPALASRPQQTLSRNTWKLLSLGTVIPCIEQPPEGNLSIGSDCFQHGSGGRH